MAKPKNITVLDRKGNEVMVFSTRKELADHLNVTVGRLKILLEDIEFLGPDGYEELTQFSYQPILPGGRHGEGTKLIQTVREKLLASQVKAKPGKVKNREFLNTFRNRSCEVCGRHGAEADHLRTRGASGGDEPENILALCRNCHIERHRIGLKTFVEKHKLPVEWETTGWPRRIT